MKIFSTFTGIWGFEVWLRDAGINLEIVGFSEIDKFAEKVYKKHFWDVCNFGDITKINGESLPNFDLLTGGFPCQDISLAGKMDLSKGRSMSVFSLLEILRVKNLKDFSTKSKI